MHKRAKKTIVRFNLKRSIFNSNVVDIQKLNEETNLLKNKISLMSSTFELKNVSFTKLIKIKKEHFFEIELFTTIDELLTDDIEQNSAFFSSIIEYANDKFNNIHELIVNNVDLHSNKNEVTEKEIRIAAKINDNLKQINHSASFNIIFPEVGFRDVHKNEDFIVDDVLQTYHLNKTTFDLFAKIQRKKIRILTTDDTKISQHELADLVYDCFINKKSLKINGLTTRRDGEIISVSLINATYVNS